MCMGESDWLTNIAMKATREARTEKCEGHGLKNYNYTNVDW